MSNAKREGQGRGEGGLGFAGKVLAFGGSLGAFTSQLNSNINKQHLLSTYYMFDAKLST